VSSLRLTLYCRLDAPATIVPVEADGLAVSVGVLDFVPVGIGVGVGD